MKNNLVTVLMPVFNSSRHLQNAIESILNQTYKNIEFIIINDGSRDNSEKIIKSYKDKRIRYFSNRENKGIVSALNTGLDKTRGKYIIRMDADDISRPDRIERQVEYMNRNPSVGVCGTWIEVFGNASYIWKPPVNDKEIRSMLFFESPLAHPSACIRSKLIKTYKIKYDLKYQYVEDYKLWIDLSKVSKLANIPLVLLRYRTHHNQIGSAHKNRQAAAKNQLLNDIIRNLIPEINKSSIDLHHLAMSWPKTNSYKKLIKFRSWYEKLVMTNNQSQIYSRSSFAKRIAERWVGVCYLSKNLGWKRYFFAISSRVLLLPSIKYIFQIRLSSMYQYMVATIHRFV